MPLPPFLQKAVKKRPLFAAVWAGFATIVLSPQLFFPHVESMGVTFREDTSGVELFPLTTEGRTDIEAAVAAGRLAAADLDNGFRVFMRGTLSRAAQANRIRVASRVVDDYVVEQQWLARQQIAPLWAALALLPAILLLIPTSLALSAQSRFKARR